jgi:hypothetical protein
MESAAAAAHSKTLSRLRGFLLDAEEGNILIK